MLYKFNAGGIFFEASFPQKSNGKTIIILPGLPEYPRPKKMMEDLSLKGYHVVYPRYSGTFESDGAFLKNSPSEDITSLLKELNKKDLIEIYAKGKMKIPCDKLIILATSFGGSVALEIASNKESKDKKFVIGCPVLDFKKHGDSGEQDLINLKRFLLEGFPNIYRFEEKDFDNLLEGNVISSSYNTKKFYGDITIIHGTKDEAISFNKVKEFSDLRKIKFLELEEEGHLSIEKLVKFAEERQIL